MLGATVDRAREHTSHRNPIRSLYWRSKARSPHWASVAAVPPGHVVRPRCSPMRIVAREESGCSRRIGSVQKDSAARPSPRGHASFLHSAVSPRRYRLKDREKDVQEEWLRRGRTKETTEAREGVPSVRASGVQN